MSEMSLRIALAIAEHFRGSKWTEESKAQSTILFEGAAMRVLEAMREPTDAMIQRVWAGSRPEVSHGDIEYTWSEMIDEAKRDE